MAFPEFPGDGDFEDRARWVSDHLDDKDFIENINSTVIIESLVDGQRAYSRKEIAYAEEERLQAENEGFTYKTDNICYVLGQGISKATNRFAQPGSFRLEGPTVAELVDSYLYEAAKNGWSPDDLGVATEAVVTGAIGIMFKIPFGTYQTDITVSGQGLKEETYFMDIQFRPIPKNVRQG